MPVLSALLIQWARMLITLNSPVVVIVTNIKAKYKFFSWISHLNHCWYLHSLGTVGTDHRALYQRGPENLGLNEKLIQWHLFSAQFMICSDSVQFHLSSENPKKNAFLNIREAI